MTEARQLTLEIVILGLMQYHGLHDWTFDWDRAERRFGCCFYGSKRITISYKLASINTEERVIKTALHEIAHALVGHRHHHDAVWRATCLRIGGDGERCYTDRNTVSVAPKWVGRCPTCDRVWKRHNRPQRRILFCTPCNPTPLERFSPQRAIQWRKIE
jgi:predicted SprT family Zn-dependent metalloprotease